MQAVRLFTVMLVLLLALALRDLPVSAQAISGDDLAAVMVSEDDLPGFHMVADGSAPSRQGATHEQRTRSFLANDTTVADYTLLVVILRVPNENAVCLSHLPDNIATGAVLGPSEDKPNFQRFGPLGVGDVDIFGTWSDLDPGANQWLAAGTEVFMRGQVSVYLNFATHRDHVDPDEIARFARAQDDKLLRAAAAGAPVGIVAATPVPPTGETSPEICG